jgi:hypothetical protein
MDICPLEPSAAKLGILRKENPMSKELNREYSIQFDIERRNRVEVSFYKYGSARDNFGSGRVDALATAEMCIEAFKKDHNTEHLVDAANYLMFRYMYPMPNEFFKATDSNGSVGTVGTPINMERGDW